MHAERNDGHWLNATRLRVYPRILLAVVCITYLAWLLRSHGLVDPNGKPLGNDFIEFWSASRAALSGHTLDAYDTARLFRFQQEAVPALKTPFSWIYPPSFYLLVLPLALLPYVASYCVFMLVTLIAYVSVMRQVVRGSAAMWLLAAFPGLALNVMDGQNGLLTAAIGAAPILLLGRRPYVAGCVLGLLAIKPHLALLFPVALLAIGAWRTLLAAAAAGTTLMLTGMAVLGRATLPAWLESVRVMVRSKGIPYEKMPSFLAMIRMWNAPDALGIALYVSFALFAVVMVWRVWRMSGDWRLRGAVLMAGTFLVTPYAMDYDLAWLGFPIAWLALHGMEAGWLRGERETLAAAWILPLLSSPVANHVHVQLGPFVVPALLWMTHRRAQYKHGHVQPLAQANGTLHR